jgi:hypothetical protein
MSSGMLRRVALVWTDVSEEFSSSFIRVTRIGELWTTLAVTSSRRALRRNTKWYTRRNISEDIIVLNRNCLRRWSFSRINRLYIHIEPSVTAWLYASIHCINTARNVAPAIHCIRPHSNAVHVPSSVRIQLAFGLRVAVEWVTGLLLILMVWWPKFP